MLPGSFSPAHGAAAAGLVGTEGRSPTITGASCWSSACKDNIEIPVLRCSKAANKKRLRSHRGLGERPHTPTD
jgi:hypothetical protein